MVHVHDTQALGYGLTETTVAVTFANPLDEMFGTCGHLFPSCQARLIDEQGGEITEHGKADELLIRSPSVFLGYLNNEVATNETFTEDGWLRTGDLVEFRKSEKGHDHLFVIDRLKEIIKVRSVQVSPLELGNVLLRHSKVVDTGVAGVPHDTAGKVPIAFIVRSPAAQAKDEDALRRELNSFMSDHLAEHKRLAGGIQFVEALAKSSSGKTQRKDLRDMAKAHAMEKAKSAVVVTVTDAEEFDFDFDSDEDEDIDAEAVEP